MGLDVDDASSWLASASLSVGAPGRAQASSIYLMPAIIRAAIACGADMGQVMAHLRHAAGPLAEQSAPHPLALVGGVARMATAGSGDRAKYFPLVLGEAFPFDYLSDVLAFATTSRDLRAAARAWSWMPDVLEGLGGWHASEEGDHILMGWEDGGQSADPRDAGALAEFAFAVLKGAIERLAGRDAPIASVSLRHATHAHAGHIRRHFGCEVLFSAGRNVLRLPSVEAARLLPGHDPALNALFRERMVAVSVEAVPAANDTQAAVALLSSPAPHTHWLVTKAHQMYRHNPALLGGRIDDLAAALGIPRRSLQRRLASLDLPYKALVAAIRHSFACELLEQRRQSPEAVVAVLGYANRRAFAQAFRAQAGQSLREWQLTRGLDR